VKCISFVFFPQEEPIVKVHILEWARRWDMRYADALPDGARQWSTWPGVAIMFHSVLDGRLAVRPGTVERILRDDPPLLRDILDRWGSLPDELMRPADVILAFAASFKDGQAMQRMIRSEEVFRWVYEKFGYDELALGGTSANMAVTVEALGVPRVLVYANPLTQPLAEAFPQTPALITIGPDGALGSPREVAQGDEVFAIHWIFEYRRGDALTIGPHTLVAPRANRFIPSWNPANNQLRLARGFMETFEVLAPHYSHLLVSGFHILSNRYPDGTTALDCIRPVAEYLARIRRQAPGIRLHCELASIAGGIVRQGVREFILPQMHSLGLNEVELTTWLEDLGKAELAHRIRAANAPEAVLAGVEALAEATGVPRIHLHHLGYYLVLATEGAGPPERIRQGLLCGACAAAARAMTGRPPKRDELAPVLDIPLREESLSAMRALASLVPEEDFLLTGIGTRAGRSLVVVPTRIVEHPVRTVGLGDTISASAWLAEGEA